VVHPVAGRTARPVPALSVLSTLPVRVAAAALAAGLILAALPLADARAEPGRAAPHPTPSVVQSCTGSAPITCTVDVPPGDYDVTVMLGDRERAASTSVEAESRRMMVEETATDPGEQLRRTFTVNVRAQEGQQNDHGIGRGSPGLTLTFTGDAPAVQAIGIAAAPEDGRRIVLLGDSTVADQERAPYTGWGQVLPTSFRHGVSVVNHSGSGESTSSVLADPRMWPALEQQLTDRDTVLIQLAHNDKTISAEDYRANLATLVDGVRATGATPVLVTPIVRHRFDRDGQLTPTGLIATAEAGDLPQHIREVAAENQVPLIDLTARSEELVEGLGQVDSETLYLIRENGDRTHTSELGATAYAGLVAEELETLGLVSPQFWNHGEEFFVAPDGDDTAAGDIDHPFASIARAQEAAGPGDTVTLRGGTYAYTDAIGECSGPTGRVDVIALDRSGQPGLPIRYQAHPGEKPVLDFSGVTDDCRIKGIELSADHVEVVGLEITGVPQNNSLNNESWGLRITGSHNLVDRVDAHHNMGAGIFIQEGVGNLVRNSDSHDNYDPHSKSGAGQNADGFGSHSNTVSTVPNTFEGIRAWNNADDGFDAIQSQSPVVVRDAWSWHNGYVYGTDERAASGNGTGFKLGGYGGDWEEGAAPITITGSVAFDNTLRGFYANHHPIAPVVVGNTAFDNGDNFHMLGVAEDDSDVNLGYLRNNISFGTGGLSHMDGEGVDSAHNSWDLELELTEEDFLSVSQDGWDAPRQADGSLPELLMMRPSADSALLDRGEDLGTLTAGYEGAAPDLGAFERDPSAG